MNHQKCQKVNNKFMPAKFNPIALGTAKTRVLAILRAIELKKNIQSKLYHIKNSETRG